MGMGKVRRDDARSFKVWMRTASSGLTGIRKAKFNL